jgi:hypothetical protein
MSETNERSYTDREMLEWFATKDLAMRRCVRGLREQVRIARNIVRSGMSLSAEQRRDVADGMKAALDSAEDCDRSPLYFFNRAKHPRNGART